MNDVLPRVFVKIIKTTSSPFDDIEPFWPLQLFTTIRIWQSNNELVMGRYDLNADALQDAAAALFLFSFLPPTSRRATLLVKK